VGSDDDRTHRAPARESAPRIREPEAQAQGEAESEGLTMKWTDTGALRELRKAKQRLQSAAVYFAQGGQYSEVNHLWTAIVDIDAIVARVKAAAEARKKAKGGK
jgi:hypothetical protein